MFFRRGSNRSAVRGIIMNSPPGFSPTRPQILPYQEVLVCFAGGSI